MTEPRADLAIDSKFESCGHFPPRLTLDPIGFLRGPLATKVQAARQPRAAAGTPARIELLPGRNFEHALEDLAHWELIWVIFWFHLNPGWRPKVLPPRSTTGRKGVFATRSPHRPNPIGMSVVRLERVDGLILHIRDADMLDGTPVLDLKPMSLIPMRIRAPGLAGWRMCRARARLRRSGAFGQKRPLEQMYVTSRSGQ